MVAVCCFRSFPAKIGAFPKEKILIMIRLSHEAPALVRLFPQMFTSPAKFLPPVQYSIASACPRDFCEADERCRYPPDFLLKVASKRVN
jgi:hypothetical protein